MQEKVSFQEQQGEPNRKWTKPYRYRRKNKNGQLNKCDGKIKRLLIYILWDRRCLVARAVCNFMLQAVTLPHSFTFTSKEIDGNALTEQEDAFPSFNAR
jgi:hypothetical protein